MEFLCATVNSQQANAFTSVSGSLSNNFYHDAYPWTACNPQEATRKNCPRGESCLKLKKYRNYDWKHTWAMKCELLLHDGKQKVSFQRRRLLPRISP